MAVNAQGRQQPSLIVRCESCGGRFELALRSVQRYRAAGREPRCHYCRRKDRPLTAEERTRYGAYWRERFSDAELVELANAIWGASC